MDLVGAWANVEDLVRLRRLEYEGYFSLGFSVAATMATMNYVKRIVELKAKYSIEKYPGPRVVMDSRGLSDRDLHDIVAGKGIEPGGTNIPLIQRMAAELLLGRHCMCDYCIGKKRPV